MHPSVHGTLTASCLRHVKAGGCSEFGAIFFCGLVTLFGSILQEAKRKILSLRVFLQGSGHRHRLDCHFGGPWRKTGLCFVRVSREGVAIARVLAPLAASSEGRDGEDCSLPLPGYGRSLCRRPEEVACCFAGRALVDEPLG